MLIFEVDDLVEDDHYKEKVFFLNEKSKNSND